jgi:DNA-binding XRE family transcriptional regulator
MGSLHAPPDALPLPPVPATARLTAPGAGFWVRHLEATGRVWATVLALGGAGALVELRGRARPQTLVALLRTDADCRAALAALTAPRSPAGDPAGALPSGLRVTPDVWRTKAVPDGATAARWPVPRPSRPPGQAPGAPHSRRPAPVPRRIRPPHRPPTDHDGGAAGRELRRHREAAGLGQRAAATRLRVSRSYLAEIERGRRDGPDARAVAVAGIALLGTALEARPGA